jgi:hypothetical protein
VLATDRGGSGTLDPTSLAVLVAPASGTATINVDHTIGYAASGPFTTDGFMYQVCDLGGACASASVTVSAASVPTPLTTADSASTAESAPVLVDVLANDSGGSGTLDPTSLAVVAPPGSGSAVVSSAAVTYTPHQGFNGTDTFMYQVCDVGGACAAQLVTVTVTNAAPTPSDDSAVTAKNISVTVNVLANDNDPGSDLDPSTLAVTSAPSIGVATVNLDRTITYTPNHDKKGTDSFSYRICDVHGSCATAVVTVTIVDTDKPPVVRKDTATTLSLIPVTIDVLANDTDPDDQIVPSTLALVTLPKHGTAVINANHTITYTPNALFLGKDTFKYEVCDTFGKCVAADIEVTVI